jgi:ribosome modulation factor
VGATWVSDNQGAEMTKQEWERAKELGRQAGRAGRKETDSPYKGPSVRDLHLAWLEGFVEGRRR